MRPLFLGFLFLRLRSRVFSLYFHSVVFISIPSYPVSGGQFSVSLSLSAPFPRGRTFTLGSASPPLAPLKSPLNYAFPIMRKLRQNPAVHYHPRLVPAAVPVRGSHQKLCRPGCGVGGLMGGLRCGRQSYTLHLSPAPLPPPPPPRAPQLHFSSSLIFPLHSNALHFNPHSTLTSHLITCSLSTSSSSLPTHSPPLLSPPAPAYNHPVHPHGLTGVAAGNNTAKPLERQFDSNTSFSLRQLETGGGRYRQTTLGRDKGRKRYKEWDS